MVVGLFVHPSDLNLLNLKKKKKKKRFVNGFVHFLKDTTVNACMCKQQVFYVLSITQPIRKKSLYIICAERFVHWKESFKNSDSSPHERKDNVMLCHSY